MMKVYNISGTVEGQRDDSKMKVTVMATGWDGLGCRLGFARIGFVYFVPIGSVLSCPVCLVGWWLVGSVRQ